MSILASAETLCAVSFYWWIAIQYSTHWHLVTSAFIAPLLLLRSPQSMAIGVRWFLKDWFKFETYEAWTTRRKACWLAVGALFSALSTFFVAQYLNHYWLSELKSWSLFRRATAVGALTLIVGIPAIIVILTALTSGGMLCAVWDPKGDRPVSPIILVGLVCFAGLAAASLAVTGSSVVAVAGVIVGVLGIAVGYVVVVILSGTLVDASPFSTLGRNANNVYAAIGIGTLIYIITSFCIGMAVRALFFRVIATLRHLLNGLDRIPENWRENNFVIDSSIPAEVTPGIRDLAPNYSLDGYVKRVTDEGDRSAWILHLWVVAVFFLPSFIYRLNIKATAWFWWPLFYLLRPVGVANAEGEQRQALCWPWTNPFQKLLIVLSVFFVLASLTHHYLDPAFWSVTKNVPGLTLPLKVLFAIDWTHIAPWHFAQWIIAGAGVWMLALAGNAWSHYINGNWQDHAEQWPKKVALMIRLQRVRYLATIAMLLMAIGALLLEDRWWQDCVSVPDKWIMALEKFYQIRK